MWALICVKSYRDVQSRPAMSGVGLRAGLTGHPKNSRHPQFGGADQTCGASQPRVTSRVSSAAQGTEWSLLAHLLFASGKPLAAAKAMDIGCNGAHLRLAQAVSPRGHDAEPGHRDRFGHILL